MSDPIKISAGSHVSGVRVPVDTYGDAVDGLMRELGVSDEPWRTYLSELIDDWGEAKVRQHLGMLKQLAERERRDTESREG